MPFDMNAGRNRRKQATDTTENQIELRERLKQRNQQLDAPVTADPQEEQGGAEVEPQQPTGIAAEKPCFITVAIPESIKQIVDIKVKYNSKDIPVFNQTIKHVGRRWFLRGMLAEGLITQEQFDDAAALDSEYGWERDKVSEKRKRK